MKGSLIVHNIPSGMLALQRLYHWEKSTPARVALTQPMGGGTVQDLTWAATLDPGASPKVLRWAAMRRT